MISLVAIIGFGLMVAAISIFLGLGGGIFLVPLLPMVFGVSVQSAIATSVCTIALVVTWNTWSFHRQGWIDWNLVRWMAPACVVAAFLSARFSSLIPESWALWVLLTLLIVMATRALLASFVQKDAVVAPLTRVGKLVLILGSLLAGAAAGIAGVGAGVILVPLMLSLRAVSPLKLTPTSNANMVFTTWAAGFGFLSQASEFKGWSWGLVRVDLLLGLFASSLFFQYLLAPHQNRLPFRLKSLLLFLLLIFLMNRVLGQLHFAEMIDV